MHPTTPSGSPVASSDSARVTRTRYRLGESSTARWRLLIDAAAMLADGGARPAALSTVLGKALAFLALDDGVLLQAQDDGLFVRAAQGPVTPAGARVTPTHTLLAAMQHSQQAALVRQDVVSALRIGRERQAGLEVLVPLRFDDKNRGILALLGGAAAVPPNAEDLVTLQALATLLASVLAASSQAARAAAPDPAAVRTLLTPRELQVFALLPSGMTNAEMGQRLGIATGTVKVHVERILHKLDLGDRTQAAVRAADFGFGA
ncbi:response regulator transcription factor [Massilia sp. TW-1]|uniref:Response regulator transcription factor n=1 Tax=Telluria antibiotica TaxID=2717319 RepID=A0ABX0PH70_9BURK|nr:LuxR C-terminal-related transcriptional regulator [Telluria antibiotica]NIA56385.1 response regulator transcription factor [Telluria antibiotica]